MKTILWRKLPNSGLEFCQFALEHEISFRGEVIINNEINPIYVSYLVECDIEGNTKSAEILQRTEDGEARIYLHRDNKNRWYKNDIEIKEVFGLLDIDIGVTPSTNILPIRRLKLELGESKELSAVWVRFPELSIHALEQKYTRIQKDLYLYESIVSGYKAEIKVDHNCIVQSYESEWERSNI